MTILELQKEKILSSKTNKSRSDALSLLIAGAKEIAKNEKREVVEEDIITSAKRMIKSLDSTINTIINEVGEETLIVDKYKYDIKVYKEFLPEMISEDVLESKIDEIIESIPEDQRTVKSMGRVIGSIKKEFGDAVDMAIASKIIKNKLN